MDSSLKVKFWGTRGLISSPFKDTLEFGGNTTCIQVLYKDHLIVIDAGFGASLLGEALMPRILQKKENLHVHLFFSHFHWDYVQGLPFFHPIYFPSSSLSLYAPMEKEELWKNLDLLFDGSYSPFNGINSMPSKINFTELKKSLYIGDLKIDFMALRYQLNDHHQTFAYKFTTPEDKKLVVTPAYEAEASQDNLQFIKFSSGADLLIHDAQYTQEEYKFRKNWGHSTMEQALENSRKAQAKKVLMTHHDPRRKDDEFINLSSVYKEKPEFKNIDFEFAKENVIYKV